MADTLDLQTVAEGVESFEQASRLAELGSPLVQGFYYAQPLSVPAVEAMLSNGTSGSDDPTPVRARSVSPRA